MLADFNGNRGVMVSANPQPGHSQLRYYKEERQQRRSGRSDPWAKGWRNSAKSLHNSSSIMAILVASILKYIYH